MKEKPPAPYRALPFSCRRIRRISAWCSECRFNGTSTTAARRHTENVGHETRYDITVNQQKGYRAKAVA